MTAGRAAIVLERRDHSCDLFPNLGAGLVLPGAKLPDPTACVIHCGFAEVRYDRLRALLNFSF